ncbi:MAG: sulfite exporter TauE/SafE family protein [Pseudomonadota bacterium]
MAEFLLGDTSVAAFALGAVVILCAAVVQSSAGLGFGLVAAPFLVLIDPLYVPGTVIVLGTLVSLMSSIRDFRDVNGTYVLAGIAGRIPAAILAAALIASISQEVFQIVFAALILLAVALSVWGPTVMPSIKTVTAAGVVSGFTGTLTAVGAPPFALALQHAPARELRATLNTVLLAGATISLIALGIYGEFGLADVVRGASLVPFAFLGFWLARFIIRDKRSEAMLRPAVLSLCVMACVVLLARAIIA